MELTKRYRYQSEAEARQAYCLRLLRYLGIREGSVEHKAILEDYNTLAQAPCGLPRGWTALASDDWCAEFAAGQAHAMDMTDIYPMECSCSRIIEIAKTMGIWIEDDGYVPVRADWVIFAWEAPAGENTAAPDHIGTVYDCDGEIIRTVEGNKGNAVAVRAFAVGDKRIRGYVHADYTQLIGGLIAPEVPTVAVEGVAVYDAIEEVPEAYRPTIAALIADGVLRGYGSADKLGLSEELCRALVIQDRQYRRLLEQLAAAGVLTLK